jgi:hypothetical protein
MVTWEHVVTRVQKYGTDGTLSPYDVQRGHRMIAKFARSNTFGIHRAYDHAAHSQQRSFDEHVIDFYCLVATLFRP